MLDPVLATGLAAVLAAAGLSALLAAAGSRLAARRRVLGRRGRVLEVLEQRLGVVVGAQLVVGRLVAAVVGSALIATGLGYCSS